MIPKKIGYILQIQKHDHIQTLFDKILFLTHAYITRVEYV